MSISSPDLISAITAITTLPVLSLTSLSGGGNSKVMLVRCTNNQRFVVKRYAVYAEGTSERMEREIRAFQLLMKHAVSSIPYLIGSDEQLQIAVFDYIAGKKLRPRTVTAADITGCVIFLKKLYQLKKRIDTKAVLPASEACFSLAALHNMIERRHAKLLTLDNATPTNKALLLFLMGEFAPAHAQLFSQAATGRGSMGILPDTQLAPDYWTLSPLDFGIHNVLRHNDQLVFLDFEHFGLDDPAKLISDFLLHPRNSISLPLKQQFIKEALKIFPSDRDLPGRIHAHFPLFALQWCLVLLNEFLPEHSARRIFAKGKSEQNAQMLNIQLQKARRMLQKIQDSRKYFQ